ncbi:unnamed protein product [Parajaminaea phylloscopi]
MPTQKINSSELKAKPEIYSHVTTVTGTLIYCSGQVPADSQGQLVPGDVKAHTKQCILNIETALKAAGATLSDLVKVNIYLKDMGDFNAINEVYEQMIPAPRPSRTCIQAGKLPLDTDIEIEAIAEKP